MNNNNTNNNQLNAKTNTNTNNIAINNPNKPIEIYLKTLLSMKFYS